jgi:heme-degrading monooxygenase HmoA
MIQQLLLSILPFAVAGIFSKTPIHAYGTENFIQANTVGQTLAITYVKRPWYAGRKFIIQKMKASFGQYQSIPGLEEKFYTLQQSASTLGGIYHWNSRSQAEAWFNENWFQQTAKKYGQTGIVDYYIIKTELRSKADLMMEGNYIAVLSKTATPPATNTPGLLRLITLENNESTAFVLTIWENKTTAQLAFGSSLKAMKVFDTPLLLRKLL